MLKSKNAEIQIAIARYAPVKIVNAGNRLNMKPLILAAFI